MKSKIIVAIVVIIAIIAIAVGGWFYLRVLGQVEVTTITSSDGLVSLEIPDGAVEEGIEITIEPLALDGLSDEFKELKPNVAYSLLPDGLIFQKPITVSLALSSASDQESDEMEFLFTSSNGQIEPLKDQELITDSEGRRLQGTLDHFSPLVKAPAGVSVIVTGVPTITAPNKWYKVIVTVNKQAGALTNVIDQVRYMDASTFPWMLLFSTKEELRRSKFGFGGPLLPSQEAQTITSPVYDYYCERAGVGEHGSVVIFENISLMPGYTVEKFTIRGKKTVVCHEKGISDHGRNIEFKVTPNEVIEEVHESFILELSEKPREYVSKIFFTIKDLNPGVVSKAMLADTPTGPKGGEIFQPSEPLEEGITVIGLFPGIENIQRLEYLCEKPGVTALVFDLWELVEHRDSIGTLKFKLRIGTVAAKVTCVAGEPFVQGLIGEPDEEEEDGDAAPEDEDLPPEGDAAPEDEDLPPEGDAAPEEEPAPAPPSAPAPEPVDDQAALCKQVCGSNRYNPAQSLNECSDTSQAFLCIQNKQTCFDYLIPRGWQEDSNCCCEDAPIATDASGRINCAKFQGWGINGFAVEKNPFYPFGSSTKSPGQCS